MSSAKAVGENIAIGSSPRRITLYILLGLFVSVYIFRLAQLQIIEGTIYKMESETQAIKQVRVEPNRGNFYDRYGNLIVHNEPSFSITLTRSEFRPHSMKLLTSILKIDSTQIFEELKQYKNYSQFTPLKIYRDASFETVSLIEEYSDYLPGIDVSIESKRLYEFDGNLAHILGYTNEISKRELEQKIDYHPGDQIGKSGIERSYESFLKGQVGIEYISVNKFGQKVASFDNGNRDLPSRNGSDLFLTLDIELQERGEELMKEKRGAIVALDPNNGEILSLVSAPDYDLRSFAGKIPADLYKKLSQDPNSPLLNRAIMSAYPPGSTWKMFMSIAGLQEKIISSTSTIFCGGGLQFGGRYFKCHGAHGPTNVKNAIKFSCNTFYYQLALKLGMEKFEKYGELFKFGQKTNIDLPNERAGLFPTIEWLKKRYGKNGASKGRMINFGIGQGEISCTPLQMAVYTAAIANKGTYYQPHFVRFIENNITGKKEPMNYESDKLFIEPWIFDVIHEGMYGVVNLPGGTAGAAKVTGVKVCGKTGTSQNPHGRDHAWFVCFAPMENPEIAIAVFVENGGYGGASAAPIARELLKTFFHIKTPKVQPVEPDTTQQITAETDNSNN